MTLPHALTPGAPNLKDVLNLHERNIFLKFNCHAVATVQSFNPLTQTATVTINYKQTHVEYDPVANRYNQVLEDYPLLPDCPVVFGFGGTGVLTFPIAKGDECMVLFNDRDLNNWLQGSSTSANASTRLHSFSDAVVMVGVRSVANVIKAYDSSRTVLRSGISSRVALDDNSVNLEIGPTGAPTVALALTTSGMTLTGTKATLGDGTAKVAVGGASHLIELSNTAAGSLGSLLQQLTTQLQALTTALTGSTVVTTAAAGTWPLVSPTPFATLGSNIATIATKIGQLLV